jgi:hypothetical protein
MGQEKLIYKTDGGCGAVVDHMYQAKFKEVNLENEHEEARS